MDDRHVWLNLPRDDSEFFFCVFLRTIVTFRYKQKFPKKTTDSQIPAGHRPADYIWATVTSGHCQSSLHVGRERERERGQTGASACSKTENGLADLSVGCGGQSESITQQRTIHWMPIITQFWMNLNWVNIWFHLCNPYSKLVGPICR
jgi:hypothetical protein